MSPRPRQTTLARAVREEGLGLHTGEGCSVILEPAPPDTGLVFSRSSGERLPATAEYVVDTRRCTTLGSANTRISTVEHLLSALYGLGLDNVAISLSGPEVPACDGSAQEWVTAIRRAGVRRLEAPRRELVVTEAVWAAEGDGWAVAAPGPRFALSVGVEFRDSPIGRQTCWLSVTPARYAQEVAPARTFCMEHEVAALRAAGLAKGGTLENAVVVGRDGYSQPLRFADEPVRHKAMDAIGDLALCGRRLRAQVTLVRPSHRLNVALARALRDRYPERSV